MNKKIIFVAEYGISFTQSNILQVNAAAAKITIQQFSFGLIYQF